MKIAAGTVFKGIIMYDPEFKDGADVFILAREREDEVRLSAEERARLAQCSLQSLEPADDGNAGEAWRAGAERRQAQIESWVVQTVPGDEVLARVRCR